MIDELQLRSRNCKVLADNSSAASLPKRDRFGYERKKFA